VALVGVDIGISVDVLTVTVDDIFTVEGSVLLQRFVRSEAIGIDGFRLLLYC